MCGRYRLSRRKQIIEEHFETGDWQDDWSPRYNIAPTQHIPVIRQHPKEPVRQTSTMRWGLVPHWAKDASGAASMINARSETAADKPAFRDPLKYRRCLIPADAFYEWKRSGTSKQPYCFEVKEGALFAFAGLWDGSTLFDVQPAARCSSSPNSTGTRTWMVVPPIGFDSIENVPFTSLTRSCMLVRPRPLPCPATSMSNPLPESLTTR
jgi:putative SOS response-associated peptidase YedK